MANAFSSGGGGEKMRSANLDAWNANADHWDQSLGDDGNDLFQQLIVPTVAKLVGHLRPGDRVLDLGTGNGMIARNLAREGVHVVATDYSHRQLELAALRAGRAGKQIDFRELDLLDVDALNSFVKEYKDDDRFDAVVGSMLLKELSDLRPLAKFLPRVLKHTGRVIFVNLHPCFQKPAGHRVMELRENTMTGAQEQIHWVKVTKYLHIDDGQSQALRGQPEPLIWHHRPIHALLNPFIKEKLVLGEVQEPSFNNALKPSEIQSYHNYPQIPMLFAFKLYKMED